MKTPAIFHAFGHDLLPAGAQLLQDDDPVTVGGRRLAGRLRSSGAGAVYLARDRGAGLVTVRTTCVGTTDHGPLRARLRAESACVRRLPASCTAPLIHDGTADTPPYLVSGYVEGPSLEQIIDISGPLAPSVVTALAADLARVLATVHKAGVVHGNLTPANVLLTKHGPRLIDFGVAQEISGGPAQIGAVADNPGWLAPELLTGGPPGPACDVFAWGCLVTYAATGHSPYGENTGPARVEPLDAPVRRLVGASLTEHPAARPTAAELTDGLEALTDADTVAAEPTEPIGTQAVATGPVVTGPTAGDGHGASGARRPRRVKTRAAVAVVATLAAVLLPVPAARDLRPKRPTPPAGALRPGSPVEKPRPKRGSNTAAMALYDSPPAPARKTRPAGRAEPRPPRSMLWMSCSVMRPGWCSMTRVQSFGPRWPGWRISWAPTG